MARKPIVDKEIILDLLKKGETTQRIADRFKVSRQAIDLHRKDFINKGLLPDKRAARTRNVETAVPDKPVEEEYPSPQQPPLTTGSQISPQGDIESLDTQIDLLISAFNALKILPAVEKELETLRLENEKARLEIERLKSLEKKRMEQETRWMLIQNDDLPNSSS